MSVARTSSVLAVETRIFLHFVVFWDYPFFGEPKEPTGSEYQVTPLVPFGSDNMT